MVQQLSTDVSECLEKIPRNNHQAFTSSITYLEVEDAIYNKLDRINRGIQNRRRFLIMSARPTILQTLTICDQYNISTIDFCREISEKVEQNTMLKTYGIRAADSIHIITALERNATMILSTDKDILQFDNLLINEQGDVVRCYDTDVAKNNL